MGKKNIYAVKRGRQTGLFNTWAECEQQVKGYNGALFQGFATIDEALVWLGLKPSAPPPIGALTSPAERPAPTKRSSASAPARPDTAVDYVIYTDGSCLRNPAGPGGWGVVIIEPKSGESRELSGGNPSTTNNRMEMTAAISALAAIEGSAKVKLYTDSQYLKNAFTRHWLRNWKRNGWKTAQGTDVLNQDLWQELDRLCQKHDVTFSWLKGHAGHAYNERCDRLAKGAAMKYGHRKI